MLADREKNLAQSHDPPTIQMQRLDRCPTSRRKTNHLREIIAPCEMDAPSIPTRVVKWSPLT